MVIAIKAGFFYFACVFGVGFLLGTFRVIVAAPHVGELLAVLIELPIILTTSWMICGWLVKRFKVPPYWQPRLTMGGLAFGFLMVAEIYLSVTLFGNRIDDHFDMYKSLPGTLGLAGQLVFAAFPLLRLRLP